MKVKFVCDCCDSVFDEMDIEQTPDGDDTDGDDTSLTGEASQDIILQGPEDSVVCVSLTCRECKQELDEYEPRDLQFRFYKAPLVH